MKTAPNDHARTVEIEHLDGFRFAAKLTDSISPLIIDEPPPLGGGSGPDAARLLATAVGQCLSASLLLCLQKAHVAVHDLRTRVDLSIARNEAGRLRVAGADVHITLDAERAEAKVERCTSLFEDYCIVTATVRRAFPVRVEIADGGGRILYRSADVAAQVLS